jgi:maltose alpha-D-glucosyltransferase / alpha-amylase
MPISSFSEESFLVALLSSLSPELPQFLVKQRWFGGKARTISSVEVSDIVPFRVNTLRSYFVLARVKYASGPAETYAIPLVCTSGESGQSLFRVQLEGSPEEIFLKDALTDEQFLTCLLDAIPSGASLSGMRGQIRAVATSALPSLWVPTQGPLTPYLMHAEQSNSSVIYEKMLVLKIFRRVQQGLNPDLEIGSFLTEKASFRNVPPLMGYLEYLNEEGARTALGILQGYVANQGDAWQFTLKALAEYYEKLSQGSLSAPEIPHVPLVNLCGQVIPDEARRRIGPYLDAASLLGRRTAELHLALASVPDDPDFAPQPFSEADSQAFVNSAVQLLTANFTLLRRLKDEMPEHTRHEADKVLQLQELAQRRFELFSRLKSSAVVTRIHGDYHLGQVLFTGNDFVIIDFEGEPARPLEERRRKRSPLQDVAGMLRSFHYAAYAPLLQDADSKTATHRDPEALGNWAQYWQRWVSASFLTSCLDVSGDAISIPRNREELALRLDSYLLDKAVYELGYELNNRPTWVRIPLGGIAQLLQRSTD